MKVTKYFNPRLNQYGYYMTDANGDIKALTYEDGLKQVLAVLEQIRAEIEELEPTINHGFEGFYNCQNEALKIINKAIKEQNDNV